MRHRFGDDLQISLSKGQQDGLRIEKPRLARTARFPVAAQRTNGVRSGAKISVGERPARVVVTRALRQPEPGKTCRDSRRRAGAGGYLSAFPFVFVLFFLSFPVFAQGGGETGGHSAGLALLDAARYTLAHQPQIELARQAVEIGKAQKQLASSVFDTQLSANGAGSHTYTPLSNYDHETALAAGIDTYFQNTTTSSVGGGAQKQFRSGLIAGPTLSLGRLTDNLTNQEGVNTAQLDFGLTAPLLRGRGRQVVTAPETAAQRGVEASTEDLRETLSNLVASTAASYWDYAAAIRAEEIYRDSEQRGQEFVESVRTLIQADRMAAGELHQALANLSAQTASRIAASEQVTEVRQSLGFAMGMTAMDALAIPSPADRLPETASDPAVALSASAMHAYIEDALRMRGAFLASQKRADAANTLRQAAHNSLLPQLNLVAQAGYSGLSSGHDASDYLLSIFNRARGPDISAGIQYSFSPANRAAHGQVQAAEATYREAALAGSETERAIAVAVVNALTSLQSTAAALDKAAESARFYRQALDGERDKLRLGVGSLIDLLTMESRLTGAELTLVGAQHDYAVALVRLRQATGTLLGPGPSPTVQREVFYHAPTVPGGQEK
jgi:outer membrane protein TolC